MACLAPEREARVPACGPAACGAVWACCAVVRAGWIAWQALVGTGGRLGLRARKNRAGVNSFSGAGFWLRRHFAITIS
ncbi:MAG: hypothetical protein NTX42_03185 [Methanothrix sp.]|nr:hypothetical protein [Methanothrix sp.]